MIYVAFWVAIPLLSALVGDIFRAISPWRAIARAATAMRPPRRTRPYPGWLGRWPAAVGIVAFAWVELVDVGRDDPAALSILALAYAATQLAGMLTFGIDEWADHADAFGAAWGLYARLAPLDWHDGAVWLRRPLSGLTGLDVTPGTIALLCAMIGTTTFDGFSNGPLWLEGAPHLATALGHLGLGPVAAEEVTGTIGLLCVIALVSTIYLAGVRGMTTVAAGAEPSTLAVRFVHTLVPIAWGYLLAHYFSLVVYQGQAIGYLLSDPLGTGANLLGTAGWHVDYALLSAAAIWYVQVAALITGHVAGLTLAHDRALVVFARPRQALRSQYWMLAVMVGFTCLGLYLLSAVGT